MPDGKPVGVVEGCSEPLNPIGGRSSSEPHPFLCYLPCCCSCWHLKSEIWDLHCKVSILKSNSPHSLCGNRVVWTSHKKWKLTSRILHFSKGPFTPRISEALEDIPLLKPPASGETGRISRLGISQGLGFQDTTCMMSPLSLLTLVICGVFSFFLISLYRNQFISFIELISKPVLGFIDFLYCFSTSYFIDFCFLLLWVFFAFLF